MPRQKKEKLIKIKTIKKREAVGAVEPPTLDNISGLPDELILMIFSYLTPKELLGIFRVSTKWNSIGGDPIFWQPMIERNPLLSMINNTNALFPTAKKARTAEPLEESFLKGSFKEYLQLRKNVRSEIIEEITHFCEIYEDFCNIIKDENAAYKTFETLCDPNAFSALLDSLPGFDYAQHTLAINHVIAQKYAIAQQYALIRLATAQKALPDNARVLKVLEAILNKVRDFLNKKLNENPDMPISFEINSRRQLVYHQQKKRRQNILCSGVNELKLLLLLLAQIKCPLFMYSILKINTLFSSSDSVFDWNKYSPNRDVYFHLLRMSSQPRMLSQILKRNPFNSFCRNNERIGFLKANLLSAAVQDYISPITDKTLLTVKILIKKIQEEMKYGYDELVIAESKRAHSSNPYLTPLLLIITGWVHEVRRLQSRVMKDTPGISEPFFSSSGKLEKSEEISKETIYLAIAEALIQAGATLDAIPSAMSGVSLLEMISKLAKIRASNPTHPDSRLLDIITEEKRKRQAVVKASIEEVKEVEAIPASSKLRR